MTQIFEISSITTVDEVEAFLKEAAAKSGTKHDTGKVDLTLVPLVATEAEARALMFGEKKYGRYNYTQGFEASRLVAACLRHVMAYQDGEDTDPESGLPHLGHAKACLSMLLHCDQLGTLRDNRLKKGGIK
jgi:hypothetical protein